MVFDSIKLPRFSPVQNKRKNIRKEMMYTHIPLETIPSVVFVKGKLIRTPPKKHAILHSFFFIYLFIFIFFLLSLQNFLSGAADCTTPETFDRYCKMAAASRKLGWMNSEWRNRKGDETKTVITELSLHST
jgi:hypothetical protein